ncbi:MAG TPA: serine hydrolase [Longimicrobium sp.]|nr:serine hydrolase [Longimicrobium sp.]
MRRARIVGAAALLLLVTHGARSQTGGGAELEGLWQATKRFGPDVAGRLVIDRAGGGWRASIAGRTAAVHVAGDSVAFALPDGSGAFTGRMRGGRIAGHWVQPPTVTDGMRFASPVVLEGCGTGCYAGTVTPRADEFTFYIQARRRPDGTLGAFIRNPERNLGRFMRLDRIETADSTVRLLDARGQVITRGLLRDGVMTVYFPIRGGSYDFRRVPDDAFTFFYPRGRPAASFAYAPPRDEGDGWPVGTLEEVGMARGPIEELMRRLAGEATDSIGALRVHGILIARHGKLVVEEYFHGENREKPHDTRSASKSVATVLMGAAMQAGVDISPETRVYSVLEPGVAQADARKRALTVENLLTMSSGLDCDDNNDESPGSEEYVTQVQENPDWTRVVLGLGMIRAPGDSAVYCSIQPYLAGAVLSRAAGRPLPELMHELVGEPLGMRDYYVALAPLGEAYFGGGWRFRPRDFMKLGQLYLDGGVWRGRRILSEDWVRRSSQPRYPMGRRARYGYLWWVWDYELGGRTIQAYFASGNGGQEVMVVPALDLVIATYGGNYAEGAGFLAITELIPRYILPAVVGRG